MYHYAATVLRVVDADTIDVVIDLGFSVSTHQRLRVDGIDAPEMATPAGKLARARVVELLDQAGGRQVQVATQKVEKYGRYLASVALPDGRDLAAVLVSEGHAKPYFGGKR